MNKIDHIRKTVYIVVGILTIISLVFTICKKVGLCAGSSSIGTLNNTFPLRVGDGYGHTFDFDQIDVDSIRNAVSSQNDSDLPSVDIILLDEVSGSPDGDILEVRCYYGQSYTFNPDISDFLTPTSCGITYHNGTSWPGYYIVFYNIDTDSVVSVSYARAETSVNNSVWFDPSPSGGVQFKQNSNLFGYPLWISNDDSVFTMTYSDLPSGHTKGGVLTNFIDSSDLIEDNSEVPKVDTTPPSDPSSNAGWFQKILNGIGKVNQSFQSGVLTIGDYIGSGIEKLLDKLNELKDLITGIYNWFTEDFDSNQFQSDLYSIPLISDLMGLTSLVENSGMFDWSDVTPAQTVSFTFDFGGAVLPHSTNIIDFSWYTGTVKTICNAILCTFLVLGLFVTVINQIPNIIGGHSGDRGGGSDS